MGVYDYGIAFHGKGSLGFGNDCAINSSSHIDNHKNKFLMLREGDPFDTNGSFGAPEKTFSINFSKAKAKFYFSLHYNGHNSYLFVNGEEI